MLGNCFREKVPTLVKKKIISSNPTSSNKDICHLLKVILILLPPSLSSIFYWFCSYFLRVWIRTEQFFLVQTILFTRLSIYEYKDKLNGSLTSASACFSCLVSSCSAVVVSYQHIISPSPTSLQTSSYLISFYQLFFLSDSALIYEKMCSLSIWLLVLCFLGHAFWLVCICTVPSSQFLVFCPHGFYFSRMFLSL